MPTSPSPITALPTPPSSTDPANFDTRGDALLGALPALVSETNAAGTVTYNNAVEAAAAAVSAQASQEAAAASAGAAMWSAATNYATGAAAKSPITYRTYVRKSPGGVNATDPSASSLWEPQILTRVTSGVLEHWDGAQWVPHGWAELGSLSTASGTGVTFSGIPAWVNEFALLLRGVSLNGTASLRIRLGTSGGLVSAGYSGIRQYINMANSTVGAGVTDGLQVQMGAAGVLAHGDITGRSYGNVWVVNGMPADAGVFGSMPVVGSVDLAAALTQIEVAPVSGNFDAGTVYLIGRA